MTQLQSRSDIKNIPAVFIATHDTQAAGKSCKKNIIHNIQYLACTSSRIHTLQENNITHSYYRHDIFCSVPVTVQTCHSVLFGTGPTHVGTKRSCHLGSCHLECSSLRNQLRRLTVTCITQPTTQQQMLAASMFLAQLSEPRITSASADRWTSSYLHSRDVIIPSSWGLFCCLHPTSDTIL